MFLIDSSIWLDHFADTNKEATNIIEGPYVLFSSILSLFEIKKRLIKLGFDNKVDECMKLIFLRSSIVDLNEELVDSAVDLSLHFKLGTIDSIIYSSALFNGLTLVTSDNDFRGLDNVKLINKL